MAGVCSGLSPGSNEDHAAPHHSPPPLSGVGRRGGKRRGKEEKKAMWVEIKTVS